MKKLIQSLKFMPLFFCLMFTTLQAEDKQKLKINGAILGVFNSLKQNGTGDTLASRTQFDFAGNLDFSWRIHKRVKANIQFQMGGRGSLNLAGTEVRVTDLNLEFAVQKNFQLTFGSFDAPFGADTPYLTNNADASVNAFILNSLFYGAFAGTDVGTLNTVGLKGTLETDFISLNAAVTNGTEEEAVNPDGNFALVFSTLSAPLFGFFQLGGSYISSPDSSSSGQSGTESDFSGFLLDAHLNSSSGHFLRAYYGHLAYEDSHSGGDDEVLIWKFEGKYQFKQFYLAARMSVWDPENASSSAGSISSKIPRPGFGIHDGLVSDLKVVRYQAGAGWQFERNMEIKAEWFFDDYDTTSEGLSLDVNGFIVGINILL